MLNEKKPYGVYLEGDQSFLGQDGKLFDRRTKEFVRDLNAVESTKAETTAKPSAAKPPKAKSTKAKTAKAKPVKVKTDDNSEPTDEDRK